MIWFVKKSTEVIFTQFMDIFLCPQLINTVLNAISDFFMCVDHDELSVRLPGSHLRR